MTSGQPLVLIYSAMSTGSGQVQLVNVLASADKALLDRYTASTASITSSVFQGSVPAQTAPSGTTASAPSSATGAKQTQPSPATTAKNTFRWFTTPGKGVQQNQIETILYSGKGVYTITGYQFQETWLLLLKDGWGYDNPPVTPADLAWM